MQWVRFNKSSTLLNDWEMFTWFSNTETFIEPYWRKNMNWLNKKIYYFIWFPTFQVLFNPIEELYFQTLILG